jgi:hypothetical protein
LLLNSTITMLPKQTAEYQSVDGVGLVQTAQRDCTTFCKKVGKSDRAIGSSLNHGSGTSRSRNCYEASRREVEGNTPGESGQAWLLQVLRPEFLGDGGGHVAVLEQRGPTQGGPTWAWAGRTALQSGPIDGPKQFPGVGGEGGDKVATIVILGRWHEVVPQRTAEFGDLKV